MMREKKVLQQSTHRNITQYIDFLQDSDNYYIIMELAERGNLSEFLKAKNGQRLDD